MTSSNSLWLLICLFQVFETVFLYLETSLISAIQRVTHEQKKEKVEDWMKFKVIFLPLFHPFQKWFSALISVVHKLRQVAASVINLKRVVLELILISLDWHTCSLSRSEISLVLACLQNLHQNIVFGKPFMDVWVHIHTEAQFYSVISTRQTPKNYHQFGSVFKWERSGTSLAELLF